MSHTPAPVRGEYTVTQLRPKPECLADFMPLWDARNAADARGDEAEVTRLTAAMRPFQYQVGEGFTLTDAQTADVPSAGKSHANLYLRQVLTEYYEREFNRRPAAVVKSATAVAKAAGVRQPVRVPLKAPPAQRSVQVAALLAQAEQSLAAEPLERASAIVDTALQYGSLLPEFKAFQRKVQEREEAQDLFLLSLVL